MTETLLVILLRLMITDEYHDIVSVLNHSILLDLNHIPLILLNKEYKIKFILWGI